ncbi:unannotated protein [freshwater metagenome]|uniref:Unannotated protein n=1 Tax=freshwater metagenome TaxID=449393 RepID=A0A6J6C1P3_9ZZZZ
MPVTTGISKFETASVDNLPRPGMLKTYSVITAPPSRAPRSKPKTVTIGVIAPRSTCLELIFPPDNPLALAVLT